MRIFVTGGSGFIGKHVVRELLQGKQELLLLVREGKKNALPKNKKIKIISGDMGDISKWQNELKKFKPEAAIHLAWEGIPDYGVEMSLHNLKNSLNLFQTLFESGCKTVVSAGSCWEYGAKEGKLSESAEIKAPNIFTASKASLNMLGERMAKNYGANFIWTRLFYVYGPGQKGHSLIPFVLKNLRADVVPALKDPFGQNDFVYVGDVARALAMLLKKGASGVYNIGSGNLTSTKEIVKTLYKHYPQNNGYNIIYPKGKAVLSPSFYADISRIKKEIGWKPSVDIWEGLEKTLNFYD